MKLKFEVIQVKIFSWVKNYQNVGFEIEILEF